ncbi:cytochrome D1 domain-containing protein [Salinilacihabitans rarus]|uniref:cytochrome D1 domain-containing protein n=1 Tax=Salinilacihabitans rarus TaxID=2961596 RepID=UPI0020C85F33|nr:cytochrome D1 domain-containing protein [Salinilacihabitans rarus]
MSERSDRERAETAEESVERVKRYVSATHDIAEKLEFEDELDFPDVVHLDLPQRRRFLAGTAAVGTAAIAGCSGDDDGDDDTEDGDDGGFDDESVETFELTAYQFGFEPQEIHVSEGANVRIDFVESTFEENSNFEVHDWHLAEPYDLHAVLPKNEDPNEVIDSVEFTADETGVFPFECTTYCGDGHAQMKGELLVGEDVDSIDYHNLEDIAQTHEVLTPASDLVDAPQHGVEDLLDMMVVVERDNASVSMIDMANHEVIGRIEDVGQAIHVMDFPNTLPDNEREGAYAYTMARDGYIYKLDLWGLDRVARVRAGTDARDIAVSHDGQYVAAGFYTPGQILITDADDLSPIKQISTRGIDLDGQYVESRVCALYDSPKYEVFVAGLKELGEVWLIDYTDDEFPVVAEIDCARTLHDGFFTKDGRYFMIAAQSDDVVSVVDLEERERVANIETGAIPHPGPGALDPKRDRAFTTHLGDENVTTAWSTETWEVEKRIDVPGGGLFLRNHHDCDYVWCDVALRDDPDLDQLVYAIDRETLEVDDDLVIETGSEHAIHPIFSNDGQELFVSHWPEGEIHVYDSHTGEHLDAMTDLRPVTGKFPCRRADKYEVD